LPSGELQRAYQPFARSIEPVGTKLKGLPAGEHGQAGRQFVGPGHPCPFNQNGHDTEDLSIAEAAGEQLVQPGGRVGSVIVAVAHEDPARNATRGCSHDPGPCGNRPYWRNLSVAALPAETRQGRTGEPGVRRRKSGS
jgi:hypothetical protein